MLQIKEFGLQKLGYGIQDIETSSQDLGLQYLQFFPSVFVSATSVAKIISKLISGRCLFEYKNILSIKNVYSLYLKLGQPHTARTFLNAACSKKWEDPPCYKAWSEKKCLSVTNSLGRNLNIIGHNFLYIPGIVKLFR